MPASNRNDPLRNMRFRVEIDGLATASFSAVHIGAALVQTVDYREGGDPARVRKLPGLVKYENVTLKRGITDSLDVYHWFRAVADGQVADNRRRVVIVVAEETGADRARFVVSEAWPVRYEASDLNATGNDVLIETLELANEGIERV